MTLQDFLALPPDERPLFAVSDGVGVDSTAMLIAFKRLGLRPDIILHADTGDEHPETVYREARRAWLRQVGFPDLTIVKRAPSRSGRTGKSFATLAEKCLATTAELPAPDVSSLDTVWRSSGCLQTTVRMTDGSGVRRTDHSASSRSQWAVSSPPPAPLFPWTRLSAWTRRMSSTLRAKVDMIAIAGRRVVRQHERPRGRP
jgi:hypothetical protein